MIPRLDCLLRRKKIHPLDMSVKDFEKYLLSMHKHHDSLEPLTQWLYYGLNGLVILAGMVALFYNYVSC